MFVNNPNSYSDIYAQFEKGLYTDLEFIAKCFYLLGEGDLQIWKKLPEWVQTEIINQLRDFSLNNNTLLFGNVDPEFTKVRLGKLRQWLMENKIL